MLSTRPNRLAALCCGVLLVFGGRSLAAEPSAKGAARGIEGTWEGTLKVGPAELRLVVHVAKKSDGSLTATLDSPDQGAKGIPIEEVVVKDKDVRFGLKKLGAAFEGKRADGGAEIAGHWKQGGQSFPLTLKRQAKPSETRRPQTPRPPFPYRSEEVTYENAKAGVRLAGTLTLPRGDGPFPAVVLITGSGPQDRDETIFAHKPFLVLADYLTRRGIAVLRADDRGVGKSTGEHGKATTEDFAGDTLAGVQFLKGRPDIDPKKIGLIGHSEGGAIAPLVAARCPDVAFIVLMAGPGLPGEEVLYLQGAAVLKAMGAGPEALAQERAVQELMFRAVREEKGADAAAKRIRRELAELSDKEAREKAGDKKKAKGDEKKKEQEGSAAAIDAQAKQITSPWFRFFLAYDPRPTLHKVHCPVLALNGEKDVQVDAKANLAAIAKALKEGGNPDVTIRELPGLNHLFQTCKTGGVNEYGRIEETLSPAALQVMGDWIVRHTKGDGK